MDTVLTWLIEGRREAVSLEVDETFASTEAATSALRASLADRRAWARHVPRSWTVDWSSRCVTYVSEHGYVPDIVVNVPASSGPYGVRVAETYPRTCSRARRRC